MSPSDFSILSAGIIFGIIFLFLGTDKLYKFYLGLIIGFLLYLVFNFKIALLEYGDPVSFSAFENFLFGNKDFVLSLLTGLIPLLGFLFGVFSNPLNNNKIFSFLLGLLAPIFTLGLLVYIAKSSVIELGFLSDFMDILTGSMIMDFFKNNSQYIFYLLLFLLFWRFIFLIGFAILAAFFKWLLAGIKEDEEKNEEEES